MDLHDGGTQARFRAYASEVTSVLRHADRVEPFEAYCVGLLTAEGRKSVEPLAALARVRERVLASLTREEPVQALIIDDTGFPKKGAHSVGVARQYCGQVGKQDNCQVAVSLSVATHQGSLPVAYRLYLPKQWADDPVRRAKAGVPADIVFQTKPEIALQQVRQVLADGVPHGVALMDPAYGNDSELRAGLTDLGISYAAGILPTTLLWRPGETALPPAPKNLAVAVPPRGCAVTRRISRFRPRRWPWKRRLTPGSRSRGGTAATRRCARGLPAGVSGRPTTMISAANARPRNGCVSSGRRLKTSPITTGWRPSRPTSRWSAWLIKPRCAGGSSATISN